ncbi:hypothetical protein Tco_0221562 [Tanacetum coccineum]
MLSKEKSIVSSFQEEKKRLKSDFKKREDEFLDKQILLENKIKEFDNILVKTEAAKFVRDFKSLANEANESLDRQKILELEIERLLRAIFNQEIMSIVQSNFVVDTSNLQTELEHTLDPLPQKLENENVELEFLVLNYVPKKVDKTNDLSKPVTSNSIPITKESKVMKNDNVIAPGMFRIDPCKTSREEKFVPINKVRASVRTNPITILQPHVITKKDVNSDSNGLSSTGVDNTAMTRRP